MIKGTPQFVGERLTEAREVRQMNQTALAEVIGVSRQMVSQYEKSLKSPSIDVLKKIAETLRFPLFRFTQALCRGESGPLYFRSFSAASKSERARATHRHAWLRDDISRFLSTYVEFAPVHFPDFDVPGDPTRIDDEMIEELATETRRYWGVGEGPITDVVLLLENNGAIVARQMLEATKLDAFSEWSPRDNRPYFVLGTDKASAVRSRWDAAHELGHMILHRKVRGKAVRGGEMYKIMERQAHYFAGAFLLPSRSFASEVYSMTLNNFVTMKSRWRVSVAAMIRRLADLGLISDERVKSLRVNMSVRGWSRVEPFDTEWEAEQPRFIRRAFDLILAEGVATTADIENEIGLFADDIESTAGLERGFLGDRVEHFTFPRLSR